MSPAIAAFLAALLSQIGLATLYTALPVLAPVLMRAAGEAPQSYGWMAGAVGAGSVWLLIANRAVTTTLGPVKALQAGTVAALVGAALVATGVFPLMLIGGFLIGFGYATTTPAGSQLLADHTPPEWRGTLFSLRQAGVPFGGMIAGLTASALVASFGWRSAVVTTAVFCAALCLSLWLVPRALNEARPRSPFRLSALVAPENLLTPFRVVTAIRGLGRLSLAGIGFATVQGTVNAFVVIYLTSEHGLTLGQAGGLYALMQGASAVGRLLLGFIADKVGSMRVMLAVLSAMSATSVALLAMMSADWSAIALAAVFVWLGLSISTWNGLYLAHAAALSPDRVGEATAATTFFVFAAYMIVPPVMSLVIAAAGYRAAFAVAAVAVLGAGAVLLAPARARA